MQQRQTEWLNPLLPYFERQFKQPYRSTVHFSDWLEKHGVLADARRILDFGAGMGETLYYMARRFPTIDFVGADLSETLVNEGKRHFEAAGIKNVKLECGDAFSEQSLATFRGVYDGVISLQTIMSLPDFRSVLKGLDSLGTKWIAFSTLIYDGDVNLKIEVEDYTRPQLGEPCRRELYNVCSLPLIRRFMGELGYEIDYQQFIIDRDLPKPDHSGMGTWTKKDEHGNRMQISGPLLMNWGFVLARRMK